MKTNQYNGKEEFIFSGGSIVFSSELFRGVHHFSIKTGLEGFSKAGSLLSLGDSKQSS